MARKRDTGVAVLDNGVKIAEETRDLLKKHNWQEPRRKQDPNNPDNWTTTECTTKKFTGFRVNFLRMHVELWVLGHMEADCPLSQFTPVTMADMHERVFATGGSVVTIPFGAPEEPPFAANKIQPWKRPV